MSLDLDAIKKRLASGTLSLQDTAVLLAEVERLQAAIAAFSERQKAIEKQIMMLRASTEPMQ